VTDPASWPPPGAGADALALLRRVADAVRDALAGDDVAWGPSGRKAGQYASDLVADAAALAVLADAGVQVLSEESGLTGGGALTVVVDPLDGSTNASRAIPWFATSLCALDDVGPVASLVADLPHGRRYEAVRGAGARRDGVPIAPSAASSLHESLVAISGFPPEPLGWRQFRALGAAALDLCGVADGTVDAYVDCSRSAHGPWDYLGALLVCAEVGVEVRDVHGRDLVVIEHDARRTPVAAATVSLADELHAARVAGGPPA
jgi:fructose-1,6-bisphosphatase/inositol monophosphatase family enzyme